MDFVSGLPRTPRGSDTIWVIVDRLTKSAHFLTVRKTWSLEKLAKLYALGKEKRENIYPSLVSKSFNINLFIIFFFHFD